MINLNNKEFNGFDAIGGVSDPEEIESIKIEEQAKLNNMAYLLHQVFVQNEKGKELLSKWNEILINTPSFDANSTQFDAGLNEGEKRFVRNILLHLKQVEES